MGFSRQEYWGGLPFPFPEDLPNPGIEPGHKSEGQKKANYSVYSVLLAKALRKCFSFSCYFFLRVRNIYLSKYLLGIWKEWSKTRLSFS